MTTSPEGQQTTYFQGINAFSNFWFVSFKYIHSLSRLCKHEVSQESDARVWAGPEPRLHRVRRDRISPVPPWSERAFCCFHLRRGISYGEKGKGELWIRKGFWGRGQKAVASNSTRPLRKGWNKAATEIAVVGLRFPLFLRISTVSLLSAGTRLCSHQTFDKGLFHTALLFLRFGAVCLGREIKEEQGQSWEQSDKEAPRRASLWRPGSWDPTRPPEAATWPCLRKWDPTRRQHRPKSEKMK